MEFSTNKITPNDNVKIPSMNGNNSGYQLDSELREYVQAGVSGVTEQYSNLSTYAYGKRLKHEGVEYRCIVPVETPENFDPDKWVKVDLTELDKRVLENASAINAIIDWKLYQTYTILVGDSFPTDSFPTGWKEAMFVIYAEGNSIACSIIICKNAWEAIPNNCYVKSGYYHSAETGDLYILKQNDTTYALRRAYINSEYRDTKVRVYYR